MRYEENQEGGVPGAKGFKRQQANCATLSWEAGRGLAPNHWICSREGTGDLAETGFVDKSLFG